MCVGDLKLGRQIRTVRRQFVVTTTSAVLVGSNQQRVGLKITSPDANIITVDLADTAVAGRGFTLAPGDKPCCFNLANDGDLPMRQFSIVADFGIANVVILESFLPEGQLGG